MATMAEEPWIEVEGDSCTAAVFLQKVVREDGQEPYNLFNLVLSWPDGSRSSVKSLTSADLEAIGLAALDVVGYKVEGFNDGEGDDSDALPGSDEEGADAVAEDEDDDAATD